VGTTFSFSARFGLPMTAALPSTPVPALSAVQRVPASAEPKPTLPGFTKPLHVLLVEDSEINRLVALHLLGDQNCVVRVACDGKEALTAHGEETFDVILMDVQMPEVDGFEVTQQIREREN